MVDGVHYFFGCTASILYFDFHSRSFAVAKLVIQVQLEFKIVQAAAHTIQLCVSRVIHTHTKEKREANFLWQWLFFFLTKACFLPAKMLAIWELSWTAYAPTKLFGNNSFIFSSILSWLFSGMSVRSTVKESGETSAGASLTNLPPLPWPEKPNMERKSSTKMARKDSWLFESLAAGLKWASICSSIVNSGARLVNKHTQSNQATSLYVWFRLTFLSLLEAFPFSKADSGWSSSSSGFRGGFSSSVSSFFDFLGSSLEAMAR